MKVGLLKRLLKAVIGLFARAEPLAGQSTMGITTAVRDDEVIKNADAAYSDIRASIDHQVRTASSLDTKAVAILTVVAAVAAIAVPRVRLDEMWRQVSGGVTFLAVLATVSCALWSLRPRDFSYGVHPDDLLRHIERFDRAGYAIGQVKGLRKAYLRNDATLDARLRWYLLALTGMAILVPLLGLMVITGAIQYAG